MDRPCERNALVMGVSGLVVTIMLISLALNPVEGLSASSISLHMNPENQLMSLMLLGRLLAPPVLAWFIGLGFSSCSLILLWIILFYFNINLIDISFFILILVFISIIKIRQDPIRDIIQSRAWKKPKISQFIFSIGVFLFYISFFNYNTFILIYGILLVIITNIYSNIINNKYNILVAFMSSNPITAIPLIAFVSRYPLPLDTIENKCDGITIGDAIALVSGGRHARTPMREVEGLLCVYGKAKLPINEIDSLVIIGKFNIKQFINNLSKISFSYSGLKDPSELGKLGNDIVIDRSSNKFFIKEIIDIIYNKHKYILIDLCNIADIELILFIIKNYIGKKYIIIRLCNISPVIIDHIPRGPQIGIIVRGVVEHEIFRKLLGIPDNLTKEICLLLKNIRNSFIFKPSCSRMPLIARYARNR